MKNYALRLALLSLGFFLLGTAWGFWSELQKRNRLAKATPLRVLCGENWLSESHLRDFSLKNGVPVELFTYARPTELLHQLANSDGKIDVVCTSSLLIRSLIQNNWIAKVDYIALPNLKQVSVDFLNLPYDPATEYSVPLFWDLYGFFGKGSESPSTWKQIWTTKKVSFWGAELNILYLLSVAGIRVEDQLEMGATKSLEYEIRLFLRSAARIVRPTPGPVTAEAMIANSDWTQMPLSRAARLVGGNSPYKFWLPTDGGSVDVGLLAIGEKATHPALAKLLINELLSTDHALEVHQRLDAGVVHTALSHRASIAILQKPEALRRFPLNRFRFPDVNVEALPRFEKIYQDSLASNGK